MCIRDRHNTDCRQVKEFERYVETAKQIKPDTKYQKRDQLKYITTTLDEQRNQSVEELANTELIEWLK